MAILFWFIFLLISNTTLYGVKRKIPVKRPVISHLKLSKQDAQKIGQKILHNECGGDLEKLTWWNLGEEFASMGAIHAIWYPKGVNQKFKETFPSLLLFLESRGKKLPEGIIDISKSCPWQSRIEFMASLQSKKMQKLRAFLVDTIDLQIAFALQRLEKSLPQLLRFVVKESQKNHIKQQFYRIARSKNGLYVLIDYLNFKGEGSDPLCSYHGHRWGLLQVLEGMNGIKVGSEALEDFVRSAKNVLSTRVKCAPPERDEARWLQGWYNRLDTYKEDF